MTGFTYTNRLEVDKPGAIKVIKNASQWLRDSGKEVSEWWDPKKISADFFKPYAKDDEFYVLHGRQGKTVGAVIIQEKQNLQDWSSVDGTSEPRALYIHYLSVERAHAKQAVPAAIVQIAKQMAQANGITRIRLDTNADQPKLKRVYDQLGFKEVKVLDEGDHRTVLYELEV